MAVACGYVHTVMVSEDGFAFTTGSGERGQLGHGDWQPKHRPTRIVGPAARFVMLAAGAYHTVASSSDGDLWSWGRGYEGQLGHGDTERRKSPAKLGPEVFGGWPVVMAACGFGHTLVLTAAGEIFSCGSGGYGQLGHGDLARQPLFRHVVADFGSSVSMVAAGEAHSVAVSLEGDVFAWGNGRQGQLGNDQLEDKSRPTLVEGLRGASVVMVAAGNAHTLACTEHGLLFAFGCNRDGQLGIGDRTQRMMPVCVGGEERFGSSVVSAACGEAFSFSVTAQGLLFSWGRGLAGQLGHADTTDRLQPALVTSLAYHFGAKVVAAAGGESHSAAVAADGRVFTWGTGKHPLGPLPSGLGHGDVLDKFSPTQVQEVHGGDDAEDPEGATARAVVVGRCRQHHLAPDRALAFAMGAHPRLGRMSKVLVLLPELVGQIVASCSWLSWPPGRAGELEGVVRLLGGGGMLSKWILSGEAGNDHCQRDPSDALQQA